MESASSKVTKYLALFYIMCYMCSHYVVKFVSLFCFFFQMQNTFILLLSLYEDVHIITPFASFCNYIHFKFNWEINEFIYYNSFMTCDLRL